MSKNIDDQEDEEEDDDDDFGIDRNEELKGESMDYHR